MADSLTRPLLSDEYFSVDGSMIEARVPMKSFRPKDGSGAPSATGTQWEMRLPSREEKQRDPCLDRRSRCAAIQEGELTTVVVSRLGHVIMENRIGLIVATSLTLATGTAE